MMDKSDAAAMFADGACQDIPAELLQAFDRGDVVIFAGAGVSTEDGKGLKQKLAEHVANKRGVKVEDGAFPDLMEAFSSQPDGRVGLVRLVKGRIDNVTSFDELRYLATRFHRELGTLSLVDTIVTTNWDSFFEDDCGASPFVFPEDMAFWEIAERRVLKLHGSINSFGSLIATRSDFAECKARLRSDATGDRLKHLLRTKTIVFVGFALADADFLFLQDFIKDETQGLQKPCYAVMPDLLAEDLERFESLGIEPLNGDGVAFLQKVKSHLQESKLYLPDSFYDEVEVILNYVKGAHVQLYEELDMFEHPEIIICACYQDGLMHALQRILTLRKTGAYSGRQRNYNVHESYADLQQQFIRAQRFDDVAYVEGYKRAFFFGAVYELPEVDAAPDAFFTLGYDYPLYTFDEYRELLKDIPNMHQSAYAWAKEQVRSLEHRREEGFVFHHVCRL